MEKFRAKLVQTGIESGFPRIQKMIKKDFQVSDIFKFAQKTTKHDIKILFSFIMDFTTER